MNLVYTMKVNITVIGTGYVGLVTGVCFADQGNTVVCVDNDASKIATLQKAETPIYEPGLTEILQKAIKANAISFTTKLSDGVQNADVIFLALPTPPQEDGSADLSYILSVADELAGCMPARYTVVVDKSTVPVGTADQVAERLAAQGATNFDVVSNPEFTREGFAIEDFMQPERVVVGSESERATAVMQKLYASFVDKGRPFIVTSTRTAELAKYAANTFLAVKISFMNEIAQMSERVDANIDDLRTILGTDSRIGNKFLYAGIGYGGSCFPKDVKALFYAADQYGYEFKMLSAAITVNHHQHAMLVERLLDHFKHDIAGKKIAIWGLAFKPETDDIREAPALAIIDLLLAAGAEVRAYDPQASANVRKFYPQANKITLVDEKYQALDGADALLIATEWSEFVGADLKQIKQLLRMPLVLDGRNIFTPEQMKKAGFTYYSVGRSPVLAPYTESAISG